MMVTQAVDLRLCLIGGFDGVLGFSLLLRQPLLQPYTDVISCVVLDEGKDIPLVKNRMALPSFASSTCGIFPPPVESFYL